MILSIFLKTISLWFLSALLLASNCGGSKIGNRSNNNITKGQSGKKGNKDAMIIHLAAEEEAATATGGTVAAATGGDAATTDRSINQQPEAVVKEKEERSIEEREARQSNLLERLKKECPQAWRLLNWLQEHCQEYWKTLWEGLQQNNLQAWCFLQERLRKEGPLQEEPQQWWQGSPESWKAMRKDRLVLWEWLQQQEEIQLELLREEREV
ncbi:hypothetical protein [Candidatus Cardinium hertigii]|jgi:hypothetical protein|uniref:hypothetical protein n=1 Tax=Candidatus Cardinium hertigii TaxID=247481 RepID=UPI00161929B8|nr:hypothetical protein [Candidatus Cardinium hertigii]